MFLDCAELPPFCRGDDAEVRGETYAQAGVKSVAWQPIKHPAIPKMPELCCDIVQNVARKKKTRSTNRPKHLLDPLC